MYQRVMIIGRLGRDPESRFTSSGDAVTSFSVAVDKKWTKDGAVQQRTTWFRVTTWRNLAEICNQYLHKGSLVMVEGEMLEPKAWQKKDGTWAASLDLTASTVKFLSSKSDDGRDEGASIEDESVPF